jgi:hypothetical protein
MILYRYTGDIKKLKPNGWTFQKLYARNYKSYRKNGIWMFVISKMRLEIDNIKTSDQGKVVKFILDNMNQPDSFWQETSPFFEDTLFPSWAIQKGEVMSRKQANKNKRDWFLAFEKDESIPYLEDGEPIRFKWVQTIKELIELGGIDIVNNL